MELLDIDSQYQIGLLRDLFEQHITTALPFARIHGIEASRIANTSSIGFGDLNGEALLLQLERADVIASSGSACASGGNQPSHVLSAMGLDNTHAQATLRFSLSRYSTAGEIEQSATAVVGIASALYSEQSTISA